MKIALVVGSMAVSVSVQAAVISLSTPVSDSLTPDGIYWTYNNESGGLVADESGNGYNGTLTGGLNNGSPVNTPTLAGGVNLPGTSGYGDAASLVGKSNVPSYTGNMNPSIRYENFGDSVPAFSMPSGASFTGGTWLNSSSTPPPGFINMYLMSSGQTFASTPHWSLFLYHQSDTLYLGFSVGNGSQSSGITAIGNILDGTWHHVGFNFNGGTNQVTLWIDGEQLPTQLNLTNGIGEPSGYEQKTFRVGERVSGSFEEMPYTGKFDDTFVTSGLHSFAAVPEPTTLALMAGAGLGMLVLRRRRLA